MVGLLEHPGRTGVLLAVAAAAVPLACLWVTPAPPGAFAGICLGLAVLLALCAVCQRSRVTAAYGGLLGLLVILVGHGTGVGRRGTFAAAAGMLLLTGVLTAGNRMWTLVRDDLVERLRAGEAARRRADERLSQVEASLERRIAERTDELRELSSRDELTGLYNRRHFMQALERAVRTPAHLCVLMIDADHFKAVNDTGGHAAGDRVLQILADTMSRSARAQDLVARIGGEEFAVLVYDAEDTNGHLLAERIRRGVADIDWPADLRLPRARVTVSVGHATAFGPATGATSLLQRADAALYAAKRAGRNRVSGSGDPG